MDLTDTIASNGDGNAIEGAPMLPSLPPAPVLPTITDLHDFAVAGDVAAAPPSEPRRQRVVRGHAHEADSR